MPAWRFSPGKQGFSGSSRRSLARQSLPGVAVHARSFFRPVRFSSPKNPLKSAMKNLVRPLLRVGRFITDFFFDRHFDQHASGTRSIGFSQAGGA
jgi:hypothetical protein